MTWWGPFIDLTRFLARPLDPCSLLAPDRSNFRDLGPRLFPSHSPIQTAEILTLLGLLLPSPTNAPSAVKTNGASPAV